MLKLALLGLCLVALAAVSANFADFEIDGDFPEIDVAPAEPTPIVCGGDGWVTVDGTCMKVIERSDAQNWDEARDTCRGLGADLAVLDTQAKSDFINWKVEHAAVKSNDECWWIGSRRYDGDKRWGWIDTSVMTYSNWALGQNFDVLKTNENCVALCVKHLLFRTVFEWHDFGCDAQQMFVCEKKLPSSCGDGYEKVEGRCLGVISDEGALSYDDAKGVCAEQDGTLAKLENKEKNDYISEVLVHKEEQSANKCWWIGAGKYGRADFHWIDGTPFSYKNWAPFEPNNYANRGENCVGVCTHGLLQNIFQWNDLGCGDRTHFICEKDPSTCNVGMTARDGACSN